MPFKKGTMPDRLKGLGIPQSFVNQFIAVFNSSYASSKDEGKAYRQAYSVMGKALRKAGYRRVKGKWSKATKEEMTAEELSHSDIRSQLRELLQDYYSYDPNLTNYGLSMSVNEQERLHPWIVAVYPARVVYERANELWAFPYAVANEEAVLGKAPTKVKREYVPIVTHEALEGPEEIGLTVSELVVLEEDEKGASIRGVALIDEIVSQGGRGRYYSKAFNERCMAATNKFMAEGGTVTVYSRHGKAIPPPGQLPSNLPIGKVTKPLWRKGIEIWYEALIAPTTEGKDVVILLKTEVITASSIRASTYRSRKRKVGGHDVEEMIDAVIVGIDLADESGIDGAGVREVLEEAPLWTDEYTDGSTEEGTDMDWKDLTLQGILENRKDLLEEYAASVKELTKEGDKDGDGDAAAPKVAALEEQVKTLTEEKTALTDKLDAATQAVGQDKLTLAIAQASLSGVSAIVAKELTKVVKEEAEVETLLPEIRTSAIALLLGTPSETQPPTKGQSRVPESTATEEALVDDETLTEEQQTVLSLAR